MGSSGPKFATPAPPAGEPLRIALPHGELRLVAPAADRGTAAASTTALWLEHALAGGVALHNVGLEAKAAPIQRKLFKKPAKPAPQLAREPLQKRRRALNAADPQVDPAMLLLAAVELFDWTASTFNSGYEPVEEYLDEANIVLAMAKEQQVKALCERLWRKKKIPRAVPWDVDEVPVHPSQLHPWQKRVVRKILRKPQRRHLIYVGSGGNFSIGKGSLGTWLSMPGFIQACAEHFRAEDPEADGTFHGHMDATSPLLWELDRFVRASARGIVRFVCGLGSRLLWHDATLLALVALVALVACASCGSCGAGAGSCGTVWLPPFWS